MILSVDDRRIAHLDGLRTVAILWVMLFHYGVFWSSSGMGESLLPYDNTLAGIPLASVGYYGVRLFFCISGMVIMATLTRTSSIGHFAISRLFRLLPTLVLCGSLTFVATSLLGPPELMRTVPEYLISVVFLPPQHVGLLLGVDQLQWLDGAYWSLWTEVRFYAVIGILYFVFGRLVFLAWMVFVVFSFAIQLLYLFTGSDAADLASGFMFAAHQPYFTTGIALFLLSAGHQVGLAKVMLSLSFLQAALLEVILPYGLLPGSVGGGPDVISVAVGLVLVFALAILASCRSPLLDPLARKLPTAIGQASYPYYLLHQNLGLALLTPFALTPNWVSIPAMVLIQVFLVMASMVIHRQFEVGLVNPLKKKALRQITKTRTTPETAPSFQERETVPERLLKNGNHR